MKTETVETKSEKFTTTYGMSKYGRNEFAYFSITGEESVKTRRGWRVEACGQLREMIAERFPEAHKLARWHLSTLEEGPMHYVANALYWAEKAAGVSEFEQREHDPEPVETFRSHVVLLDGEAPPSLKLKVGETVERYRLRITAWLQERLPRLLETMRAELTAAGIEG